MLRWRVIGSRWQRDVACVNSSMRLWVEEELQTGPQSSTKDSRMSAA
jgi:hypothetical protein